jgi:quinoprotein dehydrogenase-associated probable ABC transporter substrate-binding protein
MSSLCRKLLSIAITLCVSVPLLGQSREYRVCADPDNLPFSNRKQQGFENRIADLLARDRHARIIYVWQRMGRGFVREYFGKSRCDLVIGIPEKYNQLLTTRPYYRSSYVFVSRRNAHLHPASLNDSSLRQMRIGVQILDDDYAPPAMALARRGMQANLVGFETTGNDAPSIMRAVADRKVDTAIVWGPLAGYFAQQYPGKLTLTPVQPSVDPPGVPFTFAISMGVKKGNTQFRDELQTFLDRRHQGIEAILRRYRVPLISANDATARGN